MKRSMKNFNNRGWNHSNCVDLFIEYGINYGYMMYIVYIDNNNQSYFSKHGTKSDLYNLIVM